MPNSPQYVALPVDRAQLCMEVAWELEAMARALPALVPRSDNGAHLIVRGACGRFVELAEILGAAIGDDVQRTPRLEQRLFLDCVQGPA